MDSRLYSTIWSLLLKEKFLGGPSNSGVRSLRGIFMVVNGIKMEVAYLTHLSKEARYLQIMLIVNKQCFSSLNPLHSRLQCIELPWGMDI